MKFPVNSLLAGNSAFRDGFARDCLVQQRVYCELRRWAMVFVAARQKGHGVVIRMIRQPPDPLMGSAPQSTSTAHVHGPRALSFRREACSRRSRQVQHLASELPIFLDLRLGLRRSPSEFAMCIASARRLTLVQSPCKDMEGSLLAC